MTERNRWFVIPSGQHEGRAHLSGWMHSAIKGEPTGKYDNGWLSFAVCPVCGVMVQADHRDAFGDQTWIHERWHAANDYPMPPDVAEAEARATSRRLTRLDPP